jgi:putative addiction module CopG family antidote
MTNGSTTVQLAPDVREMIDGLVASGAYATEEAVLRRAIRDLAEHEQVMQGLREGMADVAAGRVKSLEEFDREMRDKYSYLSE